MPNICSGAEGGFKYTKDTSYIRSDAIYLLTNTSCGNDGGAAVAATKNGKECLSQNGVSLDIEKGGHVLYHG